MVNAEKIRKPKAKITKTSLTTPTNYDKTKKNTSVTVNAPIKKSKQSTRALSAGSSEPKLGIKGKTEGRYGETKPQQL